MLNLSTTDMSSTIDSIISGELNSSNSCSQILVQGPANQAAFNYVYPFFLVLSLFGNVANIIVYTHPFLRTSPTVRLLSAKALANLLTWLVLIPTAIYVSSYPYEVYNSHDLPVRAPAEASDMIAWFYWTRINIILFINNFFSTVSVWITVAVTAEHFILVIFPVGGRKWSSMGNAHLIILATLPFSCLIHSYWIVAITTMIQPCPFSDSLPGTNHVVYQLLPAIDLKVYGRYATIYMPLNACVSMLIPLILLCFFSVKIYIELNAGKFQTNTEQKRCVVRLALATTVCHFLFEVPQVPVFFLNMIYGQETKSWAYQEEVAAVTNSLSQIGSSIPFFVYLACSARFRVLTLERFGCKEIENIPGTRRNPKRSLAAEQSMMSTLNPPSKAANTTFEKKPPLRRDQGHVNGSIDNVSCKDVEQNEPLMPIIESDQELN